MSNVAVTPITVYRITVKSDNGQMSKRCTTAKMAAEFAALHRNADWWARKGCKYPTNPMRYERFRLRRDTLERRFLKVFQKYIK